MSAKIDSAELVLGEAINDLVRNISKLPHVLQVRAISRFMDGRWIDFQILHNYETEWDYLLPDDVRESTLNLIYDANCLVRKMTGNKYYFDHLYYHGQLPSLPEPQVNQVVVDSLRANNE